MSLPDNKFIGRFPSSPKEIVLLYDTVHLFKSFRNNWITEGRQELRYTTTTGGEEHSQVAKWSDICHVWKSEQENVVRKTPLTYRACYPAPIERQKVSLMTSVFNEKVVTALELDGRKETCELVGITTRLWKILNVKHPCSHIRLNDSDRKPITSCEDENYQFLQRMLLLFEKMPNGRGPTRKATVTTQTRDAFIQTLSGLLHLSKKLLTERSWSFVMLGQFQTDVLEGEFGVFRQMAGGCYYISVEQVLYSARLRELEFFLNADAIDDLPHTAADCCTQPISDLEWTAIDHCVENVSSISDEEISSLYHVSGYIAMKSGIGSADPHIQNMDCGAFTSLLTRGKLQHPPEWLFKFTQAAYALFNDLPEKTCVNHIVEIFQVVFEAYFLESCTSTHTISKRLCNCFMKGEARKIMDVGWPQTESARKLRKLDGRGDMN
jgi:hypothetical protein